MNLSRDVMLQVCTVCTCMQLHVHVFLETAFSLYVATACELYMETIECMRT